MTRLLIVIIAITALALGVAHRRWARALPSGTIEVQRIPSIARAIAGATMTDEDESLLASRDMFRLPLSDRSKRLAALPPSIQPMGTTHPTLTIKAIVGGPPWQAIVDGIPGQSQGAIVQAGATFGGIIIASVGRDSVRVRTADSAWTLFYRKGS
jgi:hypothetical protein